MKARLRIRSALFSVGGILLIPALFAGSPLSDAFVAHEDHVVAPQDTLIRISPLANDTFDESLERIELKVARAGHGQVKVENDHILYKPEKEFIGADTFKYGILARDGRRSVASVLVTVKQQIDFEEARRTILDGVAKVHGGVQPGTMAVFGPGACSIANYPDESGGPIIAAARWGEGRVIAVPDHQMLDMNKFGNQGDSARFFFNGLSWLTGSPSKEMVIITKNKSLATWLKDQGYEKAVSSRDLEKDLSGASVLAGWLGSNVSAEELAAIRDFVRGGGGLFLAEYGIGYKWWWKRPVHQAPGNLLLREAGIGFGDGNFSYGDLVEIGPASGEPMRVDEVVTLIADEEDSDETRRSEACAMIKHLSSALPPESSILGRIDRAVSQRLLAINPTPKTPVEDPFEKALLTRESHMLAATPVDQVRPHRTAAALYGEVPQSAERVDRTVTVDANRSRWLPLGLYAAPGEVVSLRFPADMAGKGFKVRVNAHSDNISPRSKWERPPVVHRWFPIDEPAVRVASAFGGSLFVDVGRKSSELGEIQVHVSGAILQPYYVLGQHDDAQLKRELHDLPAPYAVLESPRLIISAPSHDVRELDHPTQLMSWWDRVVDLEDELAAQAEARTSPELMNVDVQISAGAAHSGYPYQCYDKHWKNPANLEDLVANGSWGDFHELGHNHQRSHWWTFTGDGEVTVNIFSSYVLGTLNPDAKGGWAWVLSKDETLKRAGESWSSGKKYFDESNVGRRLTFYAILSHEFGWDAYRKAFASYEADAKNNPSALPRNDNQEKIDQWLVRFSRAVGRNLTPYMRDRWGIPVSDSAVSQVKDLPEWDVAG